MDIEPDGFPSRERDRLVVETCLRCGQSHVPWFTSCPSCESPLAGQGTLPLAEQIAAPLAVEEQWIDIPVSASEPGKAAMLRSLLDDLDIAYDESRRFISIPIADADQLEAAVMVWLNADYDIDDDRHLDTLYSTIRALADVVLVAIFDGRPAPNELDLR